MDCKAHVFLYKEKAGPVTMITIAIFFSSTYIFRAKAEQRLFYQLFFHFYFSAGPVVYPSYIAATRNSFLHFSIDLGASIIDGYKLSQQPILCKYVATLQLVQQSPRIHDQNRQMFEPAH